MTEIRKIVILWFTTITKITESLRLRVNFQANSFLVLLLCFHKTFQASKVNDSKQIQFKKSFDINDILLAWKLLKPNSMVSNYSDTQF